MVTWKNWKPNPNLKSTENRSNMEYSKDLSNVKPGDIRLVQFETGVDNPIKDQWIPAVITRAFNNGRKMCIEAETLEPIHWPEDPKGYFYFDKLGRFRTKRRPAYDAKHIGWVRTEGHLDLQGFPIKVWVARHKDGQAILTYHKPRKCGDYWHDNAGQSWPLPKGYFPDVTYENSPKEVTYYIEK